MGGRVLNPEEIYLLDSPIMNRSGGLAEPLSADINEYSERTKAVHMNKRLQGMKSNYFVRQYLSSLLDPINRWDLQLISIL